MKDFTQGSETSLILKFTVPMLIGNIFQQMCQLINMIIVGKFIGADAMASVGASFPIIFALVAMVLGVGIGGTVVVSQYFGIKQFDKVKQASDTIMIFLTVSGLVLGATGILFGKQVLQWTNLDPVLMDDAKLYLDINMMGMFAMFGYNAVSSVLRGMGDSVRPLYFLFVSAGLNLLLDIVFVVVLDYGIAGVASATVIAYLASFLLIIIYLNKYHPVLRYSLKNLVFDREIFRQSIRIGLPSGFQQTFVALGGLALLSIVNGFGKSVTAAYTAAGRIDMFIAMPAMNFSSALSAFVGQNLSMNYYHRIKKGFISTLYMSGIVCILLTIFIVFWGDAVMRLFVNTTEENFEEIVQTGHQYLVIVCSFYILFSSMFIINGLLRGAGATTIPMFVTLVSLWLVRLPLAYFLSTTLGMGPKGIWWSIPLGWGLGFTGSLIYYLSGKWKGKGVVNNQEILFTELEATE